MRQWDTQALRHQVARSENASPLAIQRATEGAFRKGAPFAEYDDFEDCQQQNGDKSDPSAYCGEIKKRTEDKESARTAAHPDEWDQVDSMTYELHHPSGYKGYVEDDLDAFYWWVENRDGDVVADGYVDNDDTDVADNDALTQAKMAADAALQSIAVYSHHTASEPQPPEVLSPTAMPPAGTPTGEVGTVPTAEVADDAGISDQTSGPDTLDDPQQVQAHRKTAEWVDYGTRQQFTDPSGYTINVEYRVDVVEWWISDPSGSEVMENQVEVIDDAYSAIEEAKLMAESNFQYLRESRRQSSGTKTASMWDSMVEPRHMVAGWDWDDALAGYITQGAASDFACICGSNIEAPGYSTCHCGKIWNAYTLTQEGSTRVVCREVPNRGAEVLLARRRTARKMPLQDVKGGDELDGGEVADVSASWGGKPKVLYVDGTEESFPSWETEVDVHNA